MKTTIPTRSTRPPDGAVLISRVDGRPVRYRLSQFPERPGIEVASPRAAWQLARRFARGRRAEVWFTGDGSLYFRGRTPASRRPPP